MPKLSPVEMMERARREVESAEKVAMKAIEEGAKAVLRATPLASEYTQAMGSWTFKVIIPYAKENDCYEVELSGHDEDLGDLLRRASDSDYGLAPEYVEHIPELVQSVREFGELHASYEAMFGNTAAGTPMKMDSRGQITRDW